LRERGFWWWWVGLSWSWYFRRAGLGGFFIFYLFVWSLLEVSSGLWWIGSEGMRWGMYFWGGMIVVWDIMAASFVVGGGCGGAFMTI